MALLWLFVLVVFGPGVSVGVVLLVAEVVPADVFAFGSVAPVLA